jgi:hypothetical protein
VKWSGRHISTVRREARRVGAGEAAAEGWAVGAAMLTPASVTRSLRIMDAQYALKLRTHGPPRNFLA